MPLIEDSSYRAPFGFYSGHLQTIYPALFRKLPYVTTERERLLTADDDFIDLDWARATPARKLAVLTHGLEGSSRGPYVQGMGGALLRSGWNVLAWNFRGCSGEPNRQLQSYHSGATHDLQAVLDHALGTGNYENVALIGFSLGGNITLKYTGDQGPAIDPRVRAAVGLSVACHLASSARRLENWENRIYMRRFLKTLRHKVRHKMRHFPDQLDDTGLDAMRTFRQFDGAYTAPIHGFASADDYWQQSSCLSVLDNVAIPTLLINAQDDPFLTSECFPTHLARKHPHFTLETPRHGGHMGFVRFNPKKEYWSEQRVVAFLEESLAPRI